MFIRVFLLSFALTLNAFGWGDTGHRIVGEIADRTMKKSTRMKIKKFLGTESLATASTWPDEIKSDYNKRLEVGKKWGHNHDYTDDKKIAGIINTWHYTSVPDNLKYQDAPKTKTGDIVTAMKIMEKVLRSNKSTKKDKRYALRFLIHFVGDVHQPLHVGNGKDRGGNDCYVKWFPPYKAPPINKVASASIEYINLHKLWDETIINSNKLSYSEYTEKLLSPTPVILAEGNRKTETMYDNYSGNELKKLQKTKFKIWKNTTYIDWVNESKNFRQTAYLGKVKKEDSTAKFCTYSKNDRLSMSDIPIVSYEFRHTLGKTIHLRLLQAGVRLGSLLDSIF